MAYGIAITGVGTAEEIAKALRLIANALLASKEERERTLDSPEVTDLDGAEWEDCTLMTRIKAY